MKKSFRALLAQEQSFFMSVPAVAWLVLFFYLPLVFIFLISFTQSDKALFSGFTLSHYATFFSLPFFRILFRSFSLALVTAGACLFCGYPVAYYLARKAERWKNLLLFFLVLPFWSNMLVQVYAWFAVLERHGFVNDILLSLGVIAEPLTLLNTQGATYLVMLYYYLPFMVIPIYSILEKLEDEDIEVSMDLGATQLQTFFYVTLPLSFSGMMTGVLLVFVPAFGEFAIPGLIGGNKYMYTGSLISYYYLIARNESLGAAFMMLSSVLLIVATVLIYWVALRMVTNERRVNGQ